MYRPFRTLGSVIRKTRSGETISRKDLLVSWVEGAVALAGTGMVARATYRAVDSQFVPPLTDVDGLASYVDSYIGDVETWKDNKGKLLFVLPDIHMISYHMRHAKRIDGLCDALDLALVGVEGASGVVTPETVQQDFELLLKLQKKGYEHQLAKNEEELLDTEVDRIETLEDFLDTEPLYRFAWDDRVTLIGLEGDNTEYNAINLLSRIYKKFYFPIVDKMATLRQYLERQETETSSDVLIGEIRRDSHRRKGDTAAAEKEQAAIDDATASLNEKRKLITAGMGELEEKRVKVLPYLDEQRAKISADLPGYDDGLSYDLYSSEFYEELTKLDDLHTMDMRSVTCVEIAEQEMNARNVQQCAIVYGVGHKEQILAECDKRGLSYIVFD